MKQIDQIDLEIIDGIHAFDNVITCVPYMKNQINIQTEIKF